MELIDYLKRFKDDEAGLLAFAERVGTTVGHLRNIAYGTRVASAALAMQVHQETRGEVPVDRLRPKDWHRIWPGIVATHSTVTPDGCLGGVAVCNSAAPMAVKAEAGHVS